MTDLMVEGPSPFFGAGALGAGAAGAAGAVPAPAAWLAASF